METIKRQSRLRLAGWS